MIKKFRFYALNRFGVMWQDGMEAYHAGAPDEKPSRWYNFCMQVWKLLGGEGFRWKK